MKRTYFHISANLLAAFVLLSMTGCVSESGLDERHAPSASDAITVGAAPTQVIATIGAADFESFTIGGDHYLAVANSDDGTTSAQASNIYRWNDATAAFELFQSFDTLYAADWEQFTIGGDVYLAVANQRATAPSTYNVDSVIYKWDGAQFSEFQSIATSGASDWEFVSIAGVDYLVVANSADDVSFDINSEVLRFDIAGDAFVHEQWLPTRHAQQWKNFEIDGTRYLAVANARGGDLQSSTRVVDSVIYAWDDVAGEFGQIQTIQTEGAMDWEHFTIDDMDYLAVASSGDDSTGSVDSVVYQWNGAAFVELQRIPTFTASDLEVIQNGMLTHLAVANYSKDGTRSTDSFVYEWDGGAFVAPEAIATHGATGIEHVSIDGLHYVAIANHSDDISFQIDSPLIQVDYASGKLFDEAKFLGNVLMSARASAGSTSTPNDWKSLSFIPPVNFSGHVEADASDASSAAHAQSDMNVDLDYMVPGDPTSGQIDIDRVAGLAIAQYSGGSFVNQNRYRLRVKPLEDCTLHLRLRADVAHLASTTTHPTVSFGIESGDAIVLQGEDTLSELAYLDVALTAGQSYFLRLEVVPSGHSLSDCTDEAGCVVDVTGTIQASWYID